MNGFLAVFSREIGERRIVFLVAAVLSLAPFASPLLLGQHGGFGASGAHGSEVELVAAAVLAVALSGILAVVLGGSVIAGELADRRLAFYFDRPLSGWSIWSGKLGAGFALALATGVVVLLPAALMRGASEPGLLSQLALWPAGLLLLLLVSHFLGVIGRARTSWLLLDTGAALVLAGLAWVVIRELQLWDPGFAPASIAPAAGAVLCVDLAAASAVQVIGGRTDLRRAHRLLSITLWSVLLAPALAATAYAEWYLHPSPSDLWIDVQLQADRGGRWVEVTGATWGRGDYYSHFLVDRVTGRWLRIRPAGFWHAQHFSSVMFAADGRSAVWLERDNARERSELVRIDLTRPRPEPRSTGLSFATNFMALSPDGRSIAALENNRVTVTDIPTGRLLASKAIANDAAELSFVTPGRLRIFQPGNSAGEMVVDDLDLAQDRMRTVTRIPLADPHLWWVSPDAERILFRISRRGGSPESLLYDAASGRALAVLPQRGEEQGFARFLPDGQLAQVVRSPSGREIRLFSRDGAREPALHSFHFGAGAWVLVCGQPTATDLLVMELAGPKPQAPAAAGRVVAAAAGSDSMGVRLLRLDLAHGVSIPLFTGRRHRLAELPASLPGSRSPAFLAHTTHGWTWIDDAGRRAPLVLGDH
jgi:hypothetical protein